ncbi:hypothetical protein B9Z55_027268 [Caenorhabditis nigoni]|nr:hypothetical protein B9Z55_027268 [Caenorhabditis nigoni]
MTPFELFSLSQCSKRCTELVPLAGTKDYQYIIDLSNFTITIRTGSIQQYTFSFGGTVPDAFSISSQNPILELKRFLLKFFDVFRSKQIRWFDTGIQNFDNFKSISETLIERECSIWKLHFQIQQVKETEELENILSKLQITSCLSFAKSVNLGLRFKCKRLKFPQELRIDNALWFGIDQLCSAVNSSVKIELHGSLLSIEDMSSFLEKWMAGEFREMTTFLIQIHSHRFDSNDARVLGMQLSIQSQQLTVHRRFLGRFYGCVYNGIIVKNVDGVSAVLKFETGDFNIFHFMVLA